MTTPERRRGVNPLPKIDYLTVHEVAKTMRVSPMTVYRLIHTEQLRAYRVGRSLRVDPADVATYMRGADTFTWGTA